MTTKPLTTAASEIVPREMVLNHASVHAPSASRQRVLGWLQDVATGIAKLQLGQVVGNEWRMCKPLHEMPCLPNFTLSDAIFELRRHHRDEFVLLARLSAKAPLLAAVDADAENRYWGCEGLSLTPKEGDPLLLCAVMDSVAVGLPSDNVWDKDSVTVEFKKLLPDGSLDEASECIDNLTRSAHAMPIFQRHQERLIQGTDPRTLWAQREQVFPALSFGPDVEANLLRQAKHLPTIVNKLIALDRAAAAWKEGPAPEWSIHVRDESKSVRENPKLAAHRRFPSQDGTIQLFTWHADFGYGRIHLRFDSSARRVEVGYVGPHLPLD